MGAFLKSNGPDKLLYLKDIFKKKRTVATHVLVIMVAAEENNASWSTLYIMVQSIFDYSLLHALVGLIMLSHNSWSLASKVAHYIILFKIISRSVSHG